MGIILLFNANTSSHIGYYYSSHSNGEIYNFILHNKKGELEESCSGFYDEVKPRNLPEELKQAKARGDKTAMLQVIAEMLRPEARLIMEEAKKDITTQNGYGTILKFIPSIAPYKFPFLKALELEGYPTNTLASLRQLV